uniref:PetM of cytochrome b6/f complex subunit 7 n=1 Tax=Kalanchoe fedtschenkoi TaxID=63787 RepID=A0A7N0T3N3_KALFE
MSAAAASATFTPLAGSTTLRTSKPRATKVTYISGLNSFAGLKAHSATVSSLGLPVPTEQSFADICSSLRSEGRGGGGLAAQCNAVDEIFKIAAIMNGLVLVGVAVGFVLLRVEAFVEESE